MNKTFKYIIWTVGAISLLFALFWTFVDFSESYGIVSGKFIDDYPWGYINSTPWYYSDSTTYWIYCLVSGLVNLTAAFIIMTGFIRKHFKKVVIGSSLTILTFTIMIVSAMIVASPA